MFELTHGLKLNFSNQYNNISNDVGRMKNMNYWENTVLKEVYLLFEDLKSISENSEHDDKCGDIRV
jgi:hypothetical protein